MKNAKSQLVVVKSGRDIPAIVACAQSSERKRALQMLHVSYEAELHTMVNVICRGSYAVPHRHWIESSDGIVTKKGESFLALEGDGRLLVFDDAGHIEKVIALKGTEHTMVWIPAGVWHSLVSTSAYLVVFENKTGPWRENKDKLFHPAFPPEGDSNAEAIVRSWEMVPLTD
jgi:cupin fold WbuC family metalloprotein